MASKKVASLSPLISPPNLDLNGQLSPGSMSVNEIVLLSPTRRLSSDYSPGRKSPIGFGENVFFGSHFKSFAEVEQDKREKCQQQPRKVAGKDQVHQRFDARHGSPSSLHTGIELEKEEASGSTATPVRTNVPKDRVFHQGTRQHTTIPDGSNIDNEDSYSGNKFHSSFPKMSAVTFHLPEDKKEFFKGACPSFREMLPALRGTFRLIGEEGYTSKNSTMEKESCKEDASTAVSSTEQGNDMYSIRGMKTSRKPIKPYVNERKEDSMPFVYPFGPKSQDKPQQLIRHALETTMLKNNSRKKNTLRCKAKTVAGELELEDIETKEEKIPQIKCVFVEQQWRTEKQHEQQEQQQQQQQQHHQHLQRPQNQKQPQVKIWEPLGQNELNAGHFQVEVSCFRNEYVLQGDIDMLEDVSRYPPRNSSARLVDILTPIELEAQRRHIRRQQQKEQNRKKREENSLFD